MSHEGWEALKHIGDIFTLGAIAVALILRPRAGRKDDDGAR